jgi:hypothetical protein
MLDESGQEHIVLAQIDGFFWPEAGVA